MSDRLPRAGVRPSQLIKIGGELRTGVYSRSPKSRGRPDSRKKIMAAPVRPVGPPGGAFVEPYGRWVYPTHIGQSAQVVAVRFYYWYIMRSFPVAGSSKTRTFCKDLDDAVTSRNVKKDESESWLSVEFLCVGHTRQPYYHNKTTSHARDPWIRPSSTFAAW